MNLKVILTLLAVALAALICDRSGRALPPLDEQNMDYWEPDLDADDYSRYEGLDYPNEPYFIGVLHAGRLVPHLGYPLHLGNQIGLSDTIMIHVKLINRTTSVVYLGGQNPGTWFVPYLYDFQADVRTEPYLMDTSKFHYQFRFWADERFQKLDTPPTSLCIDGTECEEPALTYYLWGISEGRYHLVMKKTTSAPANLTSVNANSIIKIGRPKTLADTCNAYAASFWRMYFSNNWSAAMTWANNIITRNPKSISGYRLKGVAASFLGQTSMQLAALDSVIKFSTYYLDPALPDTVNMNDYEKLWILNLRENAIWMKNMILNPPQGEVPTRM